MMTKLNDLQAILLSTAASRDDRSLLPVAATVAGAGARLTKAIATLLTGGFAEERETGDNDAIHRADGDLRFGVFITEAGSAAIGVSDAGQADDTAPSPVPEAAPRATKASTVMSLLQRAEGATIADLIAATGWLPHTTRAALTGIRKKGHTIDKAKRGDATCYRIVAAAAR